jgi:hypothetical protein
MQKKLLAISYRPGERAKSQGGHAGPLGEKIRALKTAGCGTRKNAFATGRPVGWVAEFT